MQKKPPKSAGPSKIGDLLGEFLHINMPTTINDEVRLFTHWKAAVGAEIAKRAAPTSFKNGVLFVETQHSAWITELNARRHHIQRKLNELMGKELVREIFFRRSKGTP
jgi:predicted nucleic acid-binding Zn ribbon protein